MCNAVHLSARVWSSVAALCALLTASNGMTQGSSQVDQFYEQYRSSGSVTGPCDSLLSFSQRVQKLFDNTSWFAEKEYFNSISAQRKFFFTNTGRESYKSCPNCCVENIVTQSMLTFKGRDEFGGIEGNFKTRFSKQQNIRNPNFEGKNHNTLDIICGTERSTPDSGELTLRVPVEQSGDQCTMQMPQLVMLLGSEETVYTLKIVSTSVVMRVSKDGDSRTYRKVVSTPG